jgi:hypothetical protein
VNPMLRNVLAAILGYVVMALVLFATFSVMWMVLGPAGSFEPGTWDVSPTWLVASIVLGFLAALAGGAACGRVQADRRGLFILIGLVVILGIVAALPEAAEVAGARPDDVSMTDAMSNAAQPAWITWLNPLIGVVGAWLGAGRSGRGAAAGPAPAA